MLSLYLFKSSVYTDIYIFFYLSHEHDCFMKTRSVKLRPETIAALVWLQCITSPTRWWYLFSLLFAFHVSLQADSYNNLFIVSVCKFTV